MNPMAPSKPLRILGIDPGLRSTGYGVIECTAEGLRYVASGLIQSPAKAVLSTRLHTLFTGINTVVGTHQPDVAVVEIVFVNVNPQSTLLLGQARGAAVVALAHTGLLVHEYTALQIKQTVAGHGKAGKLEVQRMVVQLLNLGQTPSADAADALAAAITHAHHQNPVHASKAQPRRTGRQRYGNGWETLIKGTSS